MWQGAGMRQADPHHGKQPGRPLLANGALSFGGHEREGQGDRQDAQEKVKAEA